ncbi:MAG: serine/threonine protein kinase, partial [Gammaproteobacteria bacterium]|nr:serine/threonine protein kinase [Gammaproteobacteria bacterium]
MMERFKDEIRLARRVTHKNVCRIYDFNRVNDVAYITMEYVDGDSLHAYLKRVGKMSPERVVDLAHQITAGLSEAHAQGVVHRDLKPENVMLARDGMVKLMDFGIARALGGNVTATQTVIGTPGYMAPEQSQGKVVDQRTDLYALGLILYECLTGKRAFSGATPVEVALKQLKERPVPLRKFVLATPPHLEAVVLRCLEKEPGRRFASAAELQRALVKPRVSPQRAPRRRKIGLTILITAVLATVMVHKAAKNAGSSQEAAASVQSAGTPTDLSGRYQVPDGLDRPLEAKQGDASAPQRVVRSNPDGPERARGERKAFYRIRRAALSGNHGAQYTLGKM